MTLAGGLVRLHDDERRPAFSRDLRRRRAHRFGERAALRAHVGADRLRRALAELAVVHVDAAHPRLRRERDEDGAELADAALADLELLLRKDDDAATLGRLVGEGRELRRVGEVVLRDTGRGVKRRRLAVAERDRPRLVEEEHVDVARSLDRAAGRRDDVRLNHAVHTRDADRREEPADRRRNEADEQRDEDGDRDRLTRTGRLHAEE